MTRRAFVTLLGCASISTLRVPGFGSRPVYAQSRINQIGVLFPAGDTPGAQSLMEELARLGHVEGRDIAYDMRAAAGRVELLPRMAHEIVARKPDVIVSATTPAARALMDATHEIPIVLALIGDPIGLGLTNSMARPNGNVTGFTTGNDTVAAKRLELLRELIPTAGKVALLWVPENGQHRLVVERTREAAAMLKTELLSLPVTTAADISLAVAKAEIEHAVALLVTADPLTIRNRRTIIDECLLRNLPAMHNYGFEVRDGALISYGSEVSEDYRRAAGYVKSYLEGR